MIVSASRLPRNTALDNNCPPARTSQVADTSAGFCRQRHTTSAINILRAALCMFTVCAAAPAAYAGVYSSPAPTVTVTPDATVLRMDLNGYGNYGVADRGSDILYTGDAHVWTFALPASLPAFSSAFFRTSLVADDHYNIPLDAYRFAVTVNGQSAYLGAANLPHGNQFAGRFTNWVTREDAVLPGATFPMTLGLRNLSVQPATQRDWIAVDWIELHLVTSAVPEPSTALLLSLALPFLTWVVRQRSRSA